MTAPTITQVSYPPPLNVLTPRTPADITDIIVHHTDGPKDQTPLEIDAEERPRGYSMMPYGYLIADDGVIFKGRPDLVRSAASFGRNPQSIAVCLIGAFEKNTLEYNGPPSQAAVKSLITLGAWLHKAYPIVRTIGHCEIAPLFYPDDEGDYSTACPGDVLFAMLPSIKEAIADLLGKS